MYDIADEQTKCTYGCYDWLHDISCFSDNFVNVIFLLKATVNVFKYIISFKVRQKVDPLWYS